MWVRHCVILGEREREHRDFLPSCSRLTPQRGFLVKAAETQKICTFSHLIKVPVNLNKTPGSSKDQVAGGIWFPLKQGQACMCVCVVLDSPNLCSTSSRPRRTGRRSAAACGTSHDTRVKSWTFNRRRCDCYSISFQK